MELFQFQFRRNPFTRFPFVLIFFSVCDLIYVPLLVLEFIVITESIKLSVCTFLLTTHLLNFGLIVLKRMNATDIPKTEPTITWKKTSQHRKGMSLLLLVSIDWIISIVVFQVNKNVKIKFCYRNFSFIFICFIEKILFYSPSVLSGGWWIKHLYWAV